MDLPPAQFRHGEIANRATGVSRPATRCRLIIRIARGASPPPLSAERRASSRSSRRRCRGRDRGIGDRRTVGLEPSPDHRSRGHRARADSPGRVEHSSPKLENVVARGDDAIFTMMPLLECGECGNSFWFLGIPNSAAPCPGVTQAGGSAFGQAESTMLSPRRPRDHSPSVIVIPREKETPFVAIGSNSTAWRRNCAPARAVSQIVNGTFRPLVGIATGTTVTGTTRSLPP